MTGSIRTSGTCRSSTWRRAGTSSRQPARTSSSPSSIPESPSRPRPCAVQRQRVHDRLRRERRSSRQRRHVLSRLGNLTLQFVAATELGPSTRFVAPRDFIWNDDAAARSQRTRDARERHRRPVDEQRGQRPGRRRQRRRHGGRRVQRQADAGQGAQHANGTTSSVRPTRGPTMSVALGIRYAADNGAEVINMSLGRTGPANCGVNPNQSGCAPAVEDAIRYAVGQGIASSSSPPATHSPRAIRRKWWRRSPRAFRAPSRSPPSTGTEGHALVFDLRDVYRAGGARRGVRRIRSDGRHSSADAQSRPGRDLRLARPRSLARRASMRWRISTSSEPRRPRRTCPVSRRC